MPNSDDHLEPSIPGCRIHLGDNLELLRTLADASVDLVYIDPPFNTHKERRHTTIRATRDEEGTRQGFQGKRYKTRVVGSMTYDDTFDDYLDFLQPRLVEARRVLAAHGSLFVHLDWREVHHVKVLLDGLFGRECFQNEIIWAYDFGGRSKSRWSAKHDNILWYSRSAKGYTFNFEAMDRIPYMAPGLVGPEKASRGKTPTDTWWHTIVPTSGKERTGYPTQKPLGVLRRIVAVHSKPGETVLDFFAGSGTTGEAAARLGRAFVLVDSNPEAAQVMAERLAFAAPRLTGFDTHQG